MKRPNPLPPDQMNPAERRAKLCALLALGLVRLRMREGLEVSDDTGEGCLHYPEDQCEPPRVYRRAKSSKDTRDEQEILHPVLPGRAA
jgi:hypothetical protein